MTPKEVTPIYSLLAWVGGVFDAGARFNLHKSKTGHSGRLTLCAPYDTILESARILGQTPPLRATTRWIRPAPAQEAILAQLLPYLRAQHKAASVLYKFRVTAPKRNFGWYVSPPIKMFRTKLTKEMNGD